MAVTGIDASPNATADAGHGVPFRDAVQVWGRIALLSFGGPAGQIAVMHRILVEEKKWIGEERFLHALNFCMLLPGPEAQQLAIYIGWLLHKTVGGLLAGMLFVLPGLISIMALSWIYVLWGNVGAVAGLFFGLKAAVLAIVAQAVFRIGGRALGNPLRDIPRQRAISRDHSVGRIDRLCRGTAREFRLWRWWRTRRRPQCERQRC